MSMNPLAAMQLSEQRKQSAWESFNKGLDDLGNLDTQLKDKNLTDGSARPGVFGGSLWKAWKPEKQEAAEEPPEAGIDKAGAWRRWAGLEPAQKRPELADIHRQAKIMGLNHDQATIDEKTGRPERDRQHDMKLAEIEYGKRKEGLDRIANTAREVCTRMNGTRNELMSAHIAQSQTTDPEAKKSISKSIAELNSQIKADQQTLREVNALLEKHGADDTYIKRGIGADGSEDIEPEFSNEEKIAYAQGAMNVVGNGTSVSKIDIIKYATENNLRPESLYKEAEDLAEKNRANERYNQEQVENKLANAGKSTSNKGGIIKTTAEEAAEQEKIVKSLNLQNNLSEFINNPTFDNYQMIASSIENKVKEEGIDYSKVPIIGSVLNLFQESKTLKEFENNKSILRRKAGDELRVVNAALGKLQKGQGKPSKLPKGEADL